MLVGGGCLVSRLGLWSMLLSCLSLSPPGPSGGNLSADPARLGRAEMRVKD